MHICILLYTHVTVLYYILASFQKNKMLMLCSNIFCSNILIIYVLVFYVLCFNVLCSNVPCSNALCSSILCFNILFSTVLMFYVLMLEYSMFSCSGVLCFNALLYSSVLCAKVLCSGVLMFYILCSNCYYYLCNKFRSNTWSYDQRQLLTELYKPIMTAGTEVIHAETFFSQRIHSFELLIQLLNQQTNPVCLTMTSRMI